MSENQPEIFANTHDLLRHLQSEGAQTARQLEQALGDVDQIGPEQIEEWIRWAIDSGFVEATGGGRYNITARGQGIIGSPDYAS
jgi:predicted transcriptional regulator